METLALVFHWFNAVVYLAMGIYCTGWTAKAAAKLGISLGTPHGTTDFRATYGGMLLAAGFFFFFAVLRGSIPLESASWLSLLLYLGLGVTRLYGVLTEKPTTRLMITFLIIELTLAVLSGWLLIDSAQADV